MAAMVGYFSCMASSGGRHHLDTTQHRLGGASVRLLGHLYLDLLDQFEELGVTPILGLEVTRLDRAIHQGYCRGVRHTVVRGLAIGGVPLLRITSHDLHGRL